MLERAVAKAAAKTPKAAEVIDVMDGDRCEVVAGTHRGKSGVVQDRKVSQTGHVTITVQEDDGERLKTLARNVVVTKKGRR